MKSLSELLKQVSLRIKDPRQGLPDEVFYFISQLTPLVNVDLLIKNEAGQTLLTWRDDDFYGPGWHIPGGIIRFKENAHTRIQKVAQQELGVTVQCAPTPLAVKEIMAKDRDVRGHFISLLFECRLTEQPSEQFKADSVSVAKPGQWLWHTGCPDNLIEQHKFLYSEFIGVPK